MTKYLFALLGTTVTGALAADSVPVVPSLPEFRILAGPPSLEFRVIDFAENRIPEPLDAEIRHVTVIRMPPGETAVEASAGDTAQPDKPGSGGWIVIISQGGSAVLVKPTKPGTDTNLDILTDLKSRWAFLVRDHTLDRGYRCRLENVLKASTLSPKYVQAERFQEVQAEAGRYKKALEDARAELARVKTAEPAGQPQETEAPVYDYKFENARRSPWRVQSIWHDSQFTYISAPRAQEHFAVYAIKDGTPDFKAAAFRPDDGVFVIHGVIDHGRLQIGSGKKMKSVDFIRVAKHG
jgi:type IV secretory pathway VirB9-like protein